MPGIFLASPRGPQRNHLIPTKEPDHTRSVVPELVCTLESLGKLKNILMSVSFAPLPKRL